MTLPVKFAPEAEEQLASIYKHVASMSSPHIAARFAGGIVNYCEGLGLFPQRGTLRADIRPGLRITSYRRRVVIAFEADGDRVAIIGVFYGGRDYESLLRTEAVAGDLSGGAFDWLRDEPDIYSDDDVVER
jgi:toxin ParE1/3/4